MILLAHGNFKDGFEFWGPFKDTVQANEWAAENISGPYQLGFMSSPHDSAICAKPLQSPVRPTPDTPMRKGG